MKLETFVRRELGIGARKARLLIASGEVEIEGRTETDPSADAPRFGRVLVGEQVLLDRSARYFLMNKPAGVVSATSDPEHRTVLDLLDEVDRVEGLHLAGRLDRATTGLLLLSNDGRWSRAITAPGSAIQKTYLVTTDQAVPEAVIAAFGKGLPLPGSGRITRPARLVLEGERQSRLTISEGRHHQVKRMFAAFDIAVEELHRSQVGSLILDPDLEPGEYRNLQAGELEIGKRPVDSEGSM